MTTHPKLKKIARSHIYKQINKTNNLAQEIKTLDVFMQIQNDKTLTYVYTIHHEAFMTCEFLHFLHLHEFICVHYATAYEIERKTKVIEYEYIIDERSVRACVYVLYEVFTLAS